MSQDDLLQKYTKKANPTFKPQSIYVEDKTYADFDLNQQLKQNLQKKGYTNPTKIQEQAISAILNNKDVLGLANTGTGKTGAFLIPIIQLMLKNPSLKCLVVTPTRELAQQIQKELYSLTYKLHIKSALLVGGVNIFSQIRTLKQNPEFIIGTPGRIKDLIERKELNLSKFNIIVLDEVDRMLDMGFLPDITFIINKLPKQKQSLFFSATMTKDIQEIANKILNDPVVIKLHTEQTIDNINQQGINVIGIEAKLNKLLDILNKIKNTKARILIFANTRFMVDKVTTFLRNNGFNANAIHGGKTQFKRFKTLQRFKTQNNIILVATDVASRGLDIQDVTLVINFDEPQNYKDYIHRIGRTGRIGKPGNAITFVDKTQRPKNRKCRNSGNRFNKNNNRWNNRRSNGNNHSSHRNYKNNRRNRF